MDGDGLITPKDYAMYHVDCVAAVGAPFVGFYARAPADLFKEREEIIRRAQDGHEQISLEALSEYMAITFLCESMAKTLDGLGESLSAVLATAGSQATFQQPGWLSKACSSHEAKEQ